MREGSVGPHDVPVLAVRLCEAHREVDLVLRRRSVRRGDTSTAVIRTEPLVLPSQSSENGVGMGARPRPASRPQRRGCVSILILGIAHGHEQNDGESGDAYASEAFVQAGSLSQVGPCARRAHFHRVHRAIPYAATRVASPGARTVAMHSSTCAYAPATCRTSSTHSRRTVTPKADNESRPKLLGTIRASPTAIANAARSRCGFVSSVRTDEVAQAHIDGIVLMNLGARLAGALPCPMRARRMRSLRTRERPHRC